MPGPKPTKKPKAKPIKHASGVFSFIDCEDLFAVGTEIFQWDTTTEEYKKEDVGTYTIEADIDVLTIDVDDDGKISNIY